MVMTAATLEDDESVVASLSAGLAPAEQGALADAFAFVRELYEGHTLGTGEAALEHAMGMAALVAELRMDASMRLAALLFTVPDLDRDAARTLNTRFGAVVTSLVLGISRLNQLRVVSQASLNAGAAQIEALRKMLLATVQDIRVIVLRLASRTQTLRYLTRAGDPVAQSRRGAIARETMDVYAPLANRLGIWQLKWELEDLSFRFLEPEVYRRVAAMLEERRIERETFIASSIAALTQGLAAAGLRAEVTGRPKHIYSIYNKMRTKNLAFAEVHDVRALRVLVDTVAECYTALGIVHDLWQPIPEDFDDYIARPKQNLYRSLHTAVMGEDGRPLEVQIRTHEMHRTAELGVAAHWRYKESARASGSYDEKIAVLRQLLAWRDEVAQSVDWADGAQRAALDQTIYVLTPDNQVIDLPRGSTPIDFAYAVHTSLGHRCRGAKVNGAIVPLDRKLENADRVEIIAARTPGSGPSRDWLNPALGYIASSRAKNKVRQWFNALEREATVAAGRAAVERELQREGRTALSHAELARALGFDTADDLFAAIGRDEVGPKQLQIAVRGSGVEPPPAPALAVPLDAAPRVARRDAASILIVGVDRLLTQLARCCKPVPPDAIRGFVTRGRGVSIHRVECPSLARLQERHPERLLDAGWGAAGGSFAVDVAVQARERIDLLRDLSEVLAREHIRLSGLQTHARDGMATVFLTVEVGSLEQLKRILPMLESVPGVATARRR